MIKYPAAKPAMHNHKYWLYYYYSILRAACLQFVAILCTYLYFISGQTLVELPAVLNQPQSITQVPWLQL